MFANHIIDVRGMTTLDVNTFPNAQTSAPQPCLYAQLPSGIHELTYTEASRRAVDDFVAHILRIYAEAQANDVGETRLFLIDNSRVGSQPIKYTLERLREVLGQMDENYSSRVAILYTNSLLINMIKSLVNSLPRRHREFRIFGVNEREAAIEWLMR